MWKRGYISSPIFETKLWLAEVNSVVAELLVFGPSKGEDQGSSLKKRMKGVMQKSGIRSFGQDCVTGQERRAALSGKYSQGESHPVCRLPQENL